MNQYEDEVLKLQKRIEKINADPDPKKLKSNKLLYEMMLNEAKERLEAWQQGKPFCDGMGILGRSMGFYSTGNVEAGFATRQPQKYLDKAKELGLPIATSCDMSMMPFSMMACGDLPMQDISITEGAAPCTPMKVRSIYISHKSKHFSYPIDVGIVPDEANYNYVLDQLKGFVEFAEQIPGIKYNEEKYLEYKSYEEAGLAYAYEIFELLKNRPAPIAGKDALRIGLRPTQTYSAKSVEVMKARRDEVAERVAKGIASVPGEKLRALWTITNPVFMDVFKVLAKWNIACLTQYEGPPMRRFAPLPLRKRPDFLLNRKLSPLEELAAGMILSAKTADEWVDGLIWTCQELHVDAIINYNMLGCTEILGMKRLVEVRAEKELGIPTLQLEGKQWDSEYADEATITAKLDEFAEMCLSQKGLI